MNAKKQKQLLVLLVLLAAAVVVLLAVKLINRAETKKEEASILHVDTVDDPTGLTLTIAEGSYRFSAQEAETDGDAAQSKEWSWEDDPAFPVKSDSINEITDLLSDLTASREISIEEDLDAYGLEEPAAAIALSDESGDSSALLLGAATGSGYYCMLEGGDVIYVIDSSLYDLLPESLTELAQVADYPAFSSDIMDSVTISGEFDQTFEVRQVEAEDTSDDEDSSETTTTTEYHWFLSGDTDVTGESLLTSLRTEIGSIEMTSLAAYKPAQEVLTACGVDNPTAILTVKYRDHGEAVTSELVIGSYDADEDVYYCILDGDTNMLYAVDAGTLENTVNVAQLGYAAAGAAADAE